MLSAFSHKRKILQKCAGAFADTFYLVRHYRPLSRRDSMISGFRVRPVVTVYTPSIPHSPRPLTAGRTRKAEIIESLLPLSQRRVPKHLYMMRPLNNV